MEDFMIVCSKKRYMLTAQALFYGLQMTSTVPANLSEA